MGDGNVDGREAAGGEDQANHNHRRCSKRLWVFILLLAFLNVVLADRTPSKTRRKSRNGKSSTAEELTGFSGGSQRKKEIGDLLRGDGEKGTKRRGGKRQHRGPRGRRRGARGHKVKRGYGRGSSAQPSSPDKLFGPYEYVHPRPKAQFVSPATTIGFREGSSPVDGSSLRDDMVSVRGSTSGTHQGKIRLADDGLTAVFVPDEPFHNGERVRVRLQQGDGSAKDTLAPQYKWYFETSSTWEPWADVEPHTQPPAQPPAGWYKPSSSRVQGQQTGGGDTLEKVDDWHLTRTDDGVDEWVVQPEGLQGPDSVVTDGESWSFYELAPRDLPQWRVTRKATEGETGEGLIFVAVNQGHERNHYLIIMTDEGQLVYFRQSNGTISDFRPHPDGNLSYIDKGTAPHFDRGGDPKCATTLSPEYQPSTSYCMQHDYRVDPHGIQISRDGRALMLAKDTQTMPNGTKARGFVLQEVDTQGLVMFEFRSWDHFTIDDGQAMSHHGDPWHANSADWTDDEHYVVNLRNAGGVIKIARSGDIVWRWGGTDSFNQFAINDTDSVIDPHDVRWLGSGRFSLFDNHNCCHAEHVGSSDKRWAADAKQCCSQPFSRAVEYQLDEDTKRATKVFEYRNSPQDYLGMITGNVQTLDNGNRVISWGLSQRPHPSPPFITEVTAAGEKVFEARFIEADDSRPATYRAFRFPWQSPGEGGSPQAKCSPQGRLHFAWNGATEVRKWMIMIGDSNPPKQHLMTVSKVRFEQWVPMKNALSACEFYMVEALDADDHALGTSDVVPSPGCRDGGGGGMTVSGVRGFEGQTGGSGGNKRPKGPVQERDQ
ncbi:unnamed protein product [Vitrella brassicaformis CCMP3155]|uniref:Uncharacterized protein n=1 Tax=Vitrella brassicaformis (strain CCMP3155) TaxID=1169540 RepID=A0A0G4EBI6_VITBC|nr:unnamed protein product [Vitrella brassicaformis CCMP3155]|eukprot:CEL93335.1 unnamed protein product [Vitrella brassicaformis CCMP3155]